MWRRRLPWVVLLLGAGAMVVAGVAMFLTHSPDPPNVDDVDARIEAEVQQCREFAIEEWTAWSEGRLSGVDSNYEDYLSSFASADQMADDQCDPSYFVGGFIQDPRFCLVTLFEPEVMWREGCPDLEASTEYTEDVQVFTIDGVEYETLRQMPSGTVPEVGLLLFVVAAVVGASFVGAEYKAGTIETTLLWEPRRRRVLASKLVSASLTAFALQVTLLTLLVLVMLPAATWRGTAAGTDAAFWYGVAGVILRGGLAAAAVAAIALSISVLTRNTVGGVAALLGYISISPIVTMVLVRGLRPFDLNENMAAFLTGGDVGRFVDRGGGDLWSVYSHGPWVAALIVAAYVAVAVLVAGAVFARRDVT